MLVTLDERSNQDVTEPRAAMCGSFQGRFNYPFARVLCYRGGVTVGTWVDLVE
jgi:hypothetical protein